MTPYYILGFTKIAELLIRNGANLNVAGPDGKTALIHAMTGGEIMDLKFLNFHFLSRQ